MAAVPSIGPAPSPTSRSAEETSDLYERYHQQIFAFCVRELRNREEAEDATQSTFLNAFRALESGTVFEHESAWLYQAAHHVCQTRRRSWYRRGRIESDGDFDRLQHILAAPTSDDDELFGLRPALESMPERQRKALLLREWQGLSYAEIATELELSQSAVETLLFRARRGLAERLTELPVEEGKLSRIGRTGDFGSLGAAIKALFFSGGIKLAATLATVAATTVVASAPSVRDAVVHFVAPAIPHAASTVKHTATKAKPVAARDLSAQVTAIPAPPVTAKPSPPRVVHRTVRAHKFNATHAAAPVTVQHAVTTTTATASTTTHASSAPTVIPAAVPSPPPAATSVPTDTSPVTTTATTTTASTTTTATTTTTASAPRGDKDNGGGGSSATAVAAVLPALSSFSPSSGFTGTVVAITGGPFTGVTSVKFNGAAAAFSAGSVLIATVPDGATSGPITVTNAAGTATTAGSFTVVTPPPPPPPVLTPTVAGFSPRNTVIGATVLIVGTHLTGTTSVSFNGVPATFTPGSDTQLTAVVPAGATSGAVTIATPQGTVTSTAIVTILAPPTVSSFSPTSGVTGTTVTISGSHIGGSPSVRFNGVSASVLSSSDSSITVQVPSSATSGPISVTTSGGTATAGSFAIGVPPTFSGLSPSSGASGTALTVSGAHFTGATAVTLNGTTAQFTVVSDSQLTVTVPAGATSGPVAVTTPAGSVTSSSLFTVSGAIILAPALSGFVPGSARVGTTVTISGSHLTGATAVRFNGVTASFAVNSDSQITATVPSSATTGAVTVTTPAGTVTSTATFVIFQ